MAIFLGLDFDLLEELWLLLTPLSYFFLAGFLSFTSPSESDDEEELLEVVPLVDEEESLDSEEESEVELLEVEEELELLPRFFNGVFAFSFVFLIFFGKFSLKHLKFPFQSEFVFML